MHSPVTTEWPFMLVASAVSGPAPSRCGQKSLVKPSGFKGLAVKKWNLSK